VGESNALAAAKAAGLPEAVLARARERMGLNDNGGQPGGGVSEKERLVSALVEALNGARATEAAAEAQRGAAMAELEAARALTGEAQRRLRAATDAAAAGSARLAQREASIAEVSLILGGPIGSHLLGRFGARGGNFRVLSLCVLAQPIQHCFHVRDGPFIPTALFLCTSRTLVRCQALAAEGLSPDLDALLTSVLAAVQGARAGAGADAHFKGRLARLGAQWPVPRALLPLQPGAVVVVAREGLFFGLQGTVLGTAGSSVRAPPADPGAEVALGPQRAPARAAARLPAALVVGVGGAQLALAPHEVAVWDTGGASWDTGGKSGDESGSGGRTRAGQHPGNLSAEVTRMLAADAYAKGRGAFGAAAGVSDAGGGGDAASRNKSSAAARKLARGLARKMAKKSDARTS
jgi:hypothetical protein